MYVIAVGNPFDGMELIGPFDYNEFAHDYAVMFLRNVDWWTMKLVAPETDEEKKP